MLEEDAIEGDEAIVHVPVVYRRSGSRCGQSRDGEVDAMSVQ